MTPAFSARCDLGLRDLQYSTQTRVIENKVASRLWTCSLTASTVQQSAGRMRHPPPGFKIHRLDLESPNQGAQQPGA